MKNGFNLKVFSGTCHEGLAAEIAGFLGTRLSERQILKFSNGETLVRVLENVRGEDCFIIQPTCTDSGIIELLIFIDALKRASAQRITAVMPWYGYARQDRKEKSREPITAKLIARLIETAGADRVLAMDLHAGAIQGFFEIPVDNLTATLLIEEEINNKMQNLVIVAPDAGAAKKSTMIAKRMNAELAIINKFRAKENTAEVMNIIGNVEGKNCVLFDDMIDTGGSLIAGAKALKEQGALRIIACASHGVLSGKAVENLKNCAEIEEVIVTNSMPSAQENGKIKVLSIASLLAEAIKRTHNNSSISGLFERRNQQRL